VNPKDLVVLVADKDAEQAVRGLLGRTESLRIRPLVADVFVHPERDPGCRARGVDFLRAFGRQYRHALIVFDREGCGWEDRPRESVEAEIEDGLSRTGWTGRSAVIALDPELEIWVWSDSPQVDSVLSWTGRQPPLRAWLEQRGFLVPGAAKPARPKEALDAALRECRRRRSSALFLRLASTVGLHRCTDAAFAKFTGTLQRWFES
jgi:hypothetical protein